MSLSDQDFLLANAYVDGEMDALGALAFEARMAAEPTLAAETERLSRLREALQSRLPAEPASDSLRRRIEAAARREAGLARSPGRVGIALAASVTLLAGMAGGAFLARQSTADPFIERMVENHIRAQVSGQPFDIASSDRHAVKPWLAARLPVSPLVVDLAAEGFALTGGRIDVVGLQPAATLVFKRNEHVISVTQTPARDTPERQALAGYRAHSWRQGAMEFVAVSDVGEPDFERFIALFRTAAARESEAPG